MNTTSCSFNEINNVNFSYTFICKTWNIHCLWTNNNILLFVQEQCMFLQHINNRLRSLLDTSFPDVNKNVETQQEKQKNIT